MHVADIMPTLLDVAGADYPDTLEGRRLPPLFGKSWVPMLAGEADAVRSDEDYLAWEIFANRALRQGNWKIRWQWKPFGKEEWQLFDLAADPAELNDLASSHPEKLASMLELWKEYVAANNVIIPSRSVFEALDDALPQRFPYAPGYPPITTQRQYVPPAELFKEVK
jgi:arylsulfatase